MAINLNPQNTVCRCIAINGSDAIFREDGKQLDFQDLMVLGKDVEQSLLFEEKHTNICVLGIQNVKTLPQGYYIQALRSYFAQYGEAVAMPYFRAKALYEWLHGTRFCHRCGHKLQAGTSEEESSMVCPNCQNTVFPRIEPCIIVLVSKGNDILLALHRQRTTKYYSCLAGFMEAGESAEQAVRREIMEETGITVRNIRYYGSQSWPFPSQLMLGFTAEYESGEIHIQESELQRAAWFPRNNCPATPPEGSLAYRLIHQE